MSGKTSAKQESKDKVLPQWILARQDKGRGLSRRGRAEYSVGIFCLLNNDPKKKRKKEIHLNNNEKSLTFNRPEENLERYYPASVAS